VEGYVGVYFRGESEFGVMSEIAGCSMAGARTITTTSGPGTLSNSPLSIQPDDLEVSFLLDTGCMVWYAENAQELFDMILAGFVVAEQPDVHVPVINVINGFFMYMFR